MSITAETIETLRAKMLEAPEIEKSKRNVSKQEAIKELRKDIESMQKRGYRLEDISKILSENGLEITTPTLKSYLQRIKGSTKKQTITASKTTKKAAVTPDSKNTKNSKDGKSSKPAGSFEVREDSEDI